MMTPQISRQTVLPRERLPERTFRLDEQTGIVRDLTKGFEATRQAIRLILLTERFRYEIYSFQYGTELEGLVGMGDSILFPEIKRRVTEALMVDDRVTGTSDFRFNRLRTRVTVRFTVHTIFGDAQQTIDL